MLARLVRGRVLASEIVGRDLVPVQEERPVAVHRTDIGDIPPEVERVTVAVADVARRAPGSVAVLDYLVVVFCGVFAVSHGDDLVRRSERVVDGGIAPGDELQAIGLGVGLVTVGERDCGVAPDVESRELAAESIGVLVAVDGTRDRTPVDRVFDFDRASVGVGFDGPGDRELVFGLAGADRPVEDDGVRVVRCTAESRPYCEGTRDSQPAELEHPSPVE